MSNFESLVNEYARIKCIVEDNEIKLRKIRDEILATGVDYLEGTYCAIQVYLQERSNFDTAKAKAMLGPDRVAECTGKPTLITGVKVVAKLEATA